MATASADGTAKLFSTVTHKCSVKLEGHSGEVSKVGVCMYEYNCTCVLDYANLELPRWQLLANWTRVIIRKLTDDDTSLDRPSNSTTTAISQTPG